MKLNNTILIISGKTIDASLLTQQEKNGYTFMFVGMLLLIIVSRRYGRKNKRKK